MHRMKANAAKPPKGLTPEQRAEWESRRMAKAWERSQQVKRKAKTPTERWKLLADLDGWTRIWIYLCALVYRLENDRHKRGVAQPEPDVLAAALADYIDLYLKKFLEQPIDYAVRLKGYRDFAFIQPNRVAVLAERVATATTTQWTAEYIEQKTREGAMSSSRGRPPGTGVFAAGEARERLVVLLDAGATHKQIANEFGVSTKTVQRAAAALHARTGPGGPVRSSIETDLIESCVTSSAVSELGTDQACS